MNRSDNSKSSLRLLEKTIHDNLLQVRAALKSTSISPQRQRKTLECIMKRQLLALHHATSIVYDDDDDLSDMETASEPTTPTTLLQSAGRHRTVPNAPRQIRTTTTGGFATPVVRKSRRRRIDSDRMPPRAPIKVKRPREPRVRNGPLFDTSGSNASSVDASSSATSSARKLRRTVKQQCL